MKKTIYITAFVLLGFIAQFLAHAVVEILYIKLLLADFQTFGLGFSFDTWFLIHKIYGVLLLIAGLLLGFQQGFYWWKRIYGTQNTAA